MSADDLARDLLAAGWIIIPPEPNPRMIGAAEQIIRANYDDGGGDRIQAALVAQEIWDAMLRYARRPVAGMTPSGEDDR